MFSLEEAFELVGFVAVLALSISFLVRVIGAVFSARIRRQIIARPVFHISWLIAVAFIWSLALLNRPPHDDPTRAFARNDVHKIASAVRAFQKAYRSPLNGDHISIIRTLRGDNPRNIEFLKIEPERLNSQGEFLDPWGTPYKIEASRVYECYVSSAGSNKIFEPNVQGVDDIYVIASWEKQK